MERDQAPILLIQRLLASPKQAEEHGNRAQYEDQVSGILEAVIGRSGQDCSCDPYDREDVREKIIQCRDTGAATLRQLCRAPVICFADSELNVHSLLVLPRREFL